MKIGLLSFVFLSLSIQGFSQNSLLSFITEGNDNSGHAGSEITYNTPAIDLYNAASDNETSVAGGSAYCASAGLSTAKEYIHTVAFNTIDYVSLNNGGYGDFTSVSTNITAGNVYAIQVKAGFTDAIRKEVWTLYIDYNGDGDFTDAKEKIGSAATSSGSILTKTFRIPVTAKNGTTRMRIQMHHKTRITDPCATFNLGEVEDYTVIISGGRDVSEIAAEETLSVVTVSPNPVTSVARLNYTLVKAGTVTFNLRDANGVQKGVYTAGRQNKGANSYQLNNLSVLRNGYYYVIVEQDRAIIGKVKLLISH